MGYSPGLVTRTLPVCVITDGNRKRLPSSGMFCLIFLFATDLLGKHVACMYSVSVNLFFILCTFVLNPRVHGNKLTALNHSNNYWDVNLLIILTFIDGYM